MGRSCAPEHFLYLMRDCAKQLACPQLAAADISPKSANSRFDPERSLTGPKFRSATSL
jgi:hypothetical protein